MYTALNEICAFLNVMPVFGGVYNIIINAKVYLLYEGTYSLVSIFYAGLPIAYSILAMVYALAFTIHELVLKAQIVFSHCKLPPSVQHLVFFF